MEVRELQRYKQLLLAKLDELSTTRAEALAPVMGAREPRGDLIDQATVQTEAELQIHLYQTDSRRIQQFSLVDGRVGRSGRGSHQSWQASLPQAFH